jgi:hypothetical protein
MLRAGYVPQTQVLLEALARIIEPAEIQDKGKSAVDVGHGTVRNQALSWRTGGLGNQAPIDRIDLARDREAVSGLRGIVSEYLFWGELALTIQRL